MAAALYTATPALLAVLAGARGSIAVLAAALAVLVAYAVRLGSPLVVLGTALALGTVELLALFGTAVGQRCGDSALAHGLELGGAVAILAAVGVPGVRRRTLWTLPLAVAAAALWTVAVAHAVPGGAGECFE